jgi:hypothetical protein
VRESEKSESESESESERERERERERESERESERDVTYRWSTDGAEATPTRSVAREHILCTRIYRTHCTVRGHILTYAYR